MPTQQDKITKYLSAKNNPAVFLLNEIEVFQREQAQALKELKQELLEKLEVSLQDKISKIEKKEVKLSYTKIAEKLVRDMLGDFKGEKGDTIRGEDGYTPVKGIDYFTEQETKEIITEIQKQIKLPENGITPVKGVDYPSEKQIREIIKNYINQIEIKQPIDGKTPVKGIDYFTSQDIESIANKIKEQIKIPEITELTAKEIRDKLQSLGQFERLDASAIKGLDRYIKKETTVKMGRVGGGGVSESIMIDGETPSGTVNGSNTEFTLAYTPRSTGNVRVYVNGMRMKAGGEDYSISNKTITFITAPPTGSIILVDYIKT